MMRSMFAGVSGLKNHQTRMDVIGNNIANVNTLGFKASRVTFAETYSQTLQGASAPQSNVGGTNPMQIGLGVNIASIDVIHTQGNTQTTGVTTDLMIDGNGFFIVANGAQQYYTRAGNFTFDTAGNLVSSSNGLLVQGWMADADGNINTNATVGNIRLPLGTTIPPRATENMVFEGGLYPGATMPDYTDLDNVVAGDTMITTTKVYDSQGVAHTITVEFARTGPAANAWEWRYSVDGADLPYTTGTDGAGNTVYIPDYTGGGDLTFNSNGIIQTGLTDTITITGLGGADDLNITLDFSQLNQYASENEAEVKCPDQNQDGYAAGTLDSYTIDQTGTIVGVFTNGMRRNIAQVAVATFSNPGGLLNAGGSLFSVSSNSGSAAIGSAGQSGRGAIKPGSVEMSNVDLSEQFTDMIITQRGFQSNSRIITTSDEMLQELVNLKR